MQSRRRFLKIGGLSGAGMLLPLKGLIKRAFAQLPGGTLPPGDIPKYVTRLVVPPAMPGAFGPNKDRYRIAVRQFQQQILPPGLPRTAVWSYGSVNYPGTFNYPAFTIEARWNKTVQVQWRNELVGANGNFLPHLLPVDQTLHWANPPGGNAGRDTRPIFASTPGRYMGPVPLVTHVHGAHTTEDSDGFAEAWYLPEAGNVPAGYARTGTYYDTFKARYGHDWAPGTATFRYRNDQRATTLWYHDHTLGMTRLNVYAGPAGFYLLRGGPDGVVLDSLTNMPAILPGPAPGVGANPFGSYYEVPIVIQDRSFNADGSLFYPDTREFFDGWPGPYIPDSDVSPIWNPEAFFNTMVVNGRTWPYLEVEQRRYRFRFLNGCNSRFLVLKFDDKRVDMWQIGAEGGFLPAPVYVNDLDVGGLGGVLLMGLAERADVIVDFTKVPVHSSVLLTNLGPDEPFGGFPTPAADRKTTRQVMQFRVVPARNADTSTPPQFLQLPAITPLVETSTRQVSLNEEVSRLFDGPIAAKLGTVGGDGSGFPLSWMEPVTENPALGATEVWEMFNFTEDAHPIHIHVVQFQVVNREPIDGGPIRGPEPWETGFKDTVISYPGEITRVRAKFDIPGLFVWHCHIVEHEDNEMMRPYQIG